MRGVIKFLISLVIGIAIIWAGFWWYAEHRLQSGFTAWAEQQATNGWKVSYDSLQRGTSPMRAELGVVHLILTPPPGPNGETVAVSLPNVILRIDALNPLVFHTDLPQQITIAVANNVDLVVNSGSITASENLAPDTLFDSQAYPFRGGDFAASNVQILASSLLVLHIDRITSQVELNLNANAAATALASTTVLDGLALSPLLTRIASVPFDGRLAHFSLAVTVSGPLSKDLPDLADKLDALPHVMPHNLAAEQKLLAPILHQWASGGGNGNIGLSLLIGPSTVTAGAKLGFDANLQPAGTADLNADRLGALTMAITNAYPALQNGISQAQAELSPYITSTAQGGQTLGMHVVYGSGGVVINGQKTGEMPKLDWNALENPLPPAPQAAGDGSGAAGLGAAGSGAAGPTPANP